MIVRDAAGAAFARLDDAPGRGGRLAGGNPAPLARRLRGTAEYEDVLAGAPA
jgi:hypothetical protein